MTKENETAKILSENLFPVVGIGASAGGLDAFKKFVKAIPKNSGMAYVLVQHLHPDHESILPEILQRETNLPVQEIEDNLEVAPDHIYIIPSNKILMATDGVLQLTPRPSKKEKHFPIDIFFESLATVHQAASIGIVLSGTGTDGTAGLKNIKDNGGITFAQSIASAAYSAMPQHAVDAGAVDFVMEPDEMPLQLIKLQRTFDILKPSADKPTKAQADDEENFRQLMAMLRMRHGVDFNDYKQTTVRRRILRRMGIQKIEKLSAYLDFLKQNKSEMDALFYDLLIPVTNFFRDTKTFDELCDQIIPRLIKNKAPNETLRLWVAGCSTGEEAYSIAMCLQETLNASGSKVIIQLFATDLSDKSIAKARQGLYAKRELENVSENRLQQFFNKIDGSYQVIKIIRDMCVFAVHNFLKDPPFAKMDFISCRNVLIYMEPFAQKRALTNFHYALNKKGLLLLGKSETTGVLQNLYLHVGKKEKLYEKKDVPGRFIPMTSARSETTMISRDQAASANKTEDFKKNADDILLSKYTPPGVVVNDQFEIVQFRGQTGQFLEPSPGTPSLHILKMAKDELSFEIRNALQKAKSTGEAFIKKDIPANGGKTLVTIEVVPLLQTPELHYLILFKKREEAIPKSKTKITGGKKESTSNAERNYISKLEKELAQTREDMRSVTEDQEAANEELQSANEELLSGSEELQSLNEELETSKEELQSTNEELVTINQELLDRNDQLNIARLYAEAIVNTINEPVVILERDFKVRSANYAFYKTFMLAEEETIGQNFFELQHNGWNIPGLRQRLLDVYARKERMIDWEAAFEFPTAGRLTVRLNAQPLQKENHEQWLLLAIHDITARKEIDNLNKRYADNLKKILESLPQITYTAAADGTVTYLNNAFLDYSGLSFVDAIKHGWESVVQPEMLPELKKRWAHCLETGEDFRMELLLKRNSDQAYRWHLSKATPIRSETGKITSWVGVSIDVNAEKVAAEKQIEFMSIASHELRTPLTTAKAYLQILQQNIREEDDVNKMLVNKAANSMERLNELVAELLDVSKIQHEKFELNITSFDMNEMLDAAVESVQFATTDHKIIKTGKVNNPVSGDEERLKQVVVNLLTNAIKYSPGKESIQLKVVENEHEIMVSVSDSGIGISKENIYKIFEMYFRERLSPEPVQGLGIGLSISAGIISRHQGRIWAESEPGKGSTFYFTIPRSN